MIAGEGLVGIILAIFAVAGMDGVINLSGLVALPSPIPELLSLLVFALMILCLLKFTIWKKRYKLRVDEYGKAEKCNKPELSGKDSC